MNARFSAYLLCLSIVIGTELTGLTGPLSVADLPEGLFTRHLLDCPPGYDPKLLGHVEDRAALSNDGRFCVVGFANNGVEGSFHVIASFDTAQNKYSDIQTIEAHFSPVHYMTNLNLCFSDDSTLLAVGIDAGVAVFRFDNKTGKLQRLWQKNFQEVRPSGPIPPPLTTFVVWLRDNRLLACSANLAFVEFEGRTGRLIRTQKHSAAVPIDMYYPALPKWALSRKHQYLAGIVDNQFFESIKSHQLLIVTDLLSGRQQRLDLTSKKPHDEAEIPAVRNLVSVHPVEKLLLAVMLDSPKLRLINLDNGDTIIPPIQPIGAGWKDITFSPDGKWLVLTNYVNLRIEPDFQIISFPDYKMRAAYRVIGGCSGYRLYFSGDGNTLGLLSQDGVLFKINWPKLAEHIQKTSRGD